MTFNPIMTLQPADSEVLADKKIVVSDNNQWTLMEAVDWFDLIS
jgi:hypothetical protein